MPEHGPMWHRDLREVRVQSGADGGMSGYVVQKRHTPWYDVWPCRERGRRAPRADANEAEDVIDQVNVEARVCSCGAPYPCVHATAARKADPLGVAGRMWPD